MSQHCSSTPVQLPLRRTLNFCRKKDIPTGKIEQKSKHLSIKRLHDNSESYIHCWSVQKNSKLRLSIWLSICFHFVEPDVTHKDNLIWISIWDLFEGVKDGGLCLSKLPHTDFHQLQSEQYKLLHPCCWTFILFNLSSYIYKHMWQAWSRPKNNATDVYRSGTHSLIFKYCVRLISSSFHCSISKCVPCNWLHHKNASVANSGITTIFNEKVMRHSWINIHFV